MNNSYEQDDETAVWRRDPVSSFSDWTIKVVQSDEDRKKEKDDNDQNSTDDGDSDALLDALLHDSDCTNPQSPQVTTTESVYNVHKVYLASGPRKSEYFQTLFSLTTKTRESLSETTTLVLPESACMAFPRFLDFIYDTTNGKNKMGRISWEEEEEEEQDVYSSLMANGSDVSVGDISVSERQESDNWIQQEVALAYLADYLRVPALAMRCQDRIPTLLNESNVHLVCREAMLYSIDWLVEACIEVASNSPRDLLPASDPQSGSLRHNAQLDPNLFDAQERRKLLLVPPALQTLWMLPPTRQVDLFRRALSKTLQDPDKFVEDDEYNYQFRT